MHLFPSLMVQNFRWLITQKEFSLFTCKCKQDFKEKYFQPPGPSTYLGRGWSLAKYIQEGLETQKENQNTFVEVKGLLLFSILISLFLCEIKLYFWETWRGRGKRWQGASCPQPYQLQGMVHLASADVHIHKDTYDGLPELLKSLF